MIDEKFQLLQHLGRIRIINLLNICCSDKTAHTTTTLPEKIIQMLCMFIALMHLEAGYLWLVDLCQQDYGEVMLDYGSKEYCFLLISCFHLCSFPCVA